MEGGSKDTSTRSGTAPRNFVSTRLLAAAVASLIVAGGHSQPLPAVPSAAVPDAAAPDAAAPDQYSPNAAAPAGSTSDFEQLPSSIALSLPEYSLAGLTNGDIADQFASYLSTPALSCLQWSTIVADTDATTTARYPSSPFKPAACNPTTLAGGLVSAQVTFTGIGQRQAFAFWDAAGGSSPGNYGTTVINAAVGCTGSIAEGVAVGQQVDQLASCIYSKLSLRGIVALLASESDKYGTTLKGDVVSTTYSLDGNDVLLLVLPANGAAPGPAEASITPPAGAPVPSAEAPPPVVALPPEAPLPAPLAQSPVPSFVPPPLSAPVAELTPALQPSAALVPPPLVPSIAPEIAPEPPAELPSLAPAVEASPPGFDIVPIGPADFKLPPAAAPAPVPGPAASPPPPPRRRGHHRHQPPPPTVQAPSPDK